MWVKTVDKMFQPEDFIKYTDAFDLSKMDWKPKGIVLHNTSEPSLKQWPSTSGEQRMENFVDFYKNIQHWHAGPHLFVAPEGIWIFTPLTEPGVHSPSYNNTHLGVEMVGEYQTEPFDRGPGEKVRSHAICALVSLCHLFNLDSASIIFHREDPRTSHKECPGKNVSKPHILDQVHQELLARRKANTPPQASASAPPAAS